MMMNIFPWLFLLVTSLLQIRGSLGEMLCEELPKEYCAFSISTSGKRCVLEHYRNKEGEKEFQCETSEVVVERMSEYIETEECVAACGVDRAALGISSDALLDVGFVFSLCSPACYSNCPNIVDLYFNLAAGEGEDLASMCQNPRRSMTGLMSYDYAQGPSRFGAPGPSRFGAPGPSILGAPGPSVLGAPLPSFVGSPF